MVKYYLLLIILLTVCFACNKKQEQMENIHFVKQIDSLYLDKWKNWNITYGSGKYTAVFRTDNLETYNRLIFWKDDSLCIRLTLPDTISKGLSIKTLAYDSLWNKYYRRMDLETLESHIDFVYKYKIQKVLSMENPDRIYFETDSVDLLYLFLPLDSGYTVFKKRIGSSNWYSK